MGVFPSCRSYITRLPEAAIGHPKAIRPQNLGKPAFLAAPSVAGTTLWRPASVGLIRSGLRPVDDGPVTQHVRRSIRDRLPRSAPGLEADAPTFDAPSFDQALAAATAEPDVVDLEVVQPEAIAVDAGPAPVRREAGRLGRFVGVLIATISIGAALVLWAIVSARTPELDRAPRVASFLGRGEFS